MKQFILFIFSIFIFCSAFGNKHLVADYEIPQSKDSLKVNFADMQKIKLYPNPAIDHLNIEYDIVFVKEAKLKIFNSIGSVIYSKNLTEKQDNIKITVNDYENGLYFCSLEIDGHLLNTKKILINH